MFSRVFTKRWPQRTTIEHPDESYCLGNLTGQPLVALGQLLEECEKFLGDKFAKPEADNNRSMECLVAENEDLSDEELTTCL